MPTQIEVGKCVHGMALAAVRVVNNIRRPKVKLQLLELAAEKDDYLLLTMSDHRQVKFAWDNMTSEKNHSEQKMQSHFDDLERCMDSTVGQICLMWDARVPGRITGMPPGMAW